MSEMDYASENRGFDEDEQREHPKPMTYLWRDIDVAWWKTVKQAALLRDMNIRQFIVWTVNVAMDNQSMPDRQAPATNAVDPHVQPQER